MNSLPKSIAELTQPSEYLEEILATPPQWIIRWAPIGVLLLIMLLLALGWLIRYPDRIPAQVVITTTQPPVPVIARSNGTLTQLLVSDHDTVETGQVLAIIQNPAHYLHVVQLERQLSQFASLRETSSDSSGLGEDSMFTNSYQLGHLQEAYALLQQAARDHHLYQRLTPYYQQRQAVGRQLHRYQTLLAQKENHQRLLARKVQLAEKDYHRNQQLHASLTIADKALEDSERVWLEVQESYEALRSELAQMRVQVATLEREWQQLSIQHTQEGEQLHTALLTRVDNLLAAIKQWEEGYLLIAPQSGQVSFSDFWSEQQVVHAGQLVMSIIPAVTLTKKDPPGIVGQLQVPVQNSGKLALGQRVEVSLANYPSEEFGTIQGVVKQISSLPKQGKYHLIIAFPDGLTTQYGNTVPFQQQLQGQAEIITEELRLVERLFYRLRAVRNTPPA